MNDLYLIPNSTVLKNLLGITNEKELDLAEAELSRANMMLLYENGFSDFSSGGFLFWQALVNIRNMNIWKKYCLTQFASSRLNIRMVI